MISGLTLGVGATAFFGNSVAAPAVANDYMFAAGLNYLNTAALGPTPRYVLDATLKSWYELESNPVMMAYGDGTVHKATDAARSDLALLIGCSAEELLISRSATAAMTAVAFGIDLARGDRVLTTDVEHEGGSAAWKFLKDRRGIQIDVVSIAPTDHDIAGIVDRIKRALRPETKVISISHVITSTGLRMPIAEIAAIARDRGILCVADGAQAVGCIDINVKSLGCHAYIGTGHKWLMGPKGTGFAYISKDSVGKIRPVEREDGVRFVTGSTGIGSLPLLVGLGAAAQALRKRGMSEVERRTLSLRNRAYAGLKTIPKIEVVSAPPGPLATALVAFRLPDNIDSRILRKELLDKYKIVVKVEAKRWFNGNRISPHIFNTEAEIDAAIKAIRTLVT